MNQRAQLAKWKRRRDRRYLRHKLSTMIARRGDVMHALDGHTGNTSGLRRLLNALVLATDKYLDRLDVHFLRYREVLPKTSRKWRWRVDGRYIGAS